MQKELSKTDTSLMTLFNDLKCAWVQFDTCTGYGDSWVRKRIQLWDKYIVYRELYISAHCAKHNNHYTPLPADINRLISEFKEKKYD